MKILKRVLILLAILIAIPLIAALFIKKEFSVVEAVVVNKPKQEVFNYIKSLKNQEQFSKWASMDPDMKRGYRGVDGQVGSVATWDSQMDDVGAGEQEVTGIKNGERIDFELRFFRPFESTETGYMTTESVGPNQTKVKWGFNGHMDYPMNLMIPLMGIEKSISDDLGIGLKNLKEIMNR